MSKKKQKMTLSDLSSLYELPVLFIEDDMEYANELYKQAQNFHFELKHVRSLEEGKDFLATDKGKAIQGIILDIRCMKRKEQEVADDTFLAAASDYFARTRPHLPVVAITGFADMYESMKHLFKDVMPVFSKGGDEKKMFEYLREKALDYEKMKIRSICRDVFETVDEYFDKKLGEMLVSCIRDMDSEEEKLMTSTLANLRKLQEGFYIALNKLDKKMVPDDFIFDKRHEPNVNNERIIKHLKGNFEDGKGETTTAYIKYKSYEDRLLYFVYKGCSGELHLSPQKTSRYTVQALVYAFLDMVLWLRRLAQSKP